MSELRINDSYEHVLSQINHKIHKTVHQNNLCSGADYSGTEPPNRKPFFLCVWFKMSLKSHYLPTDCSHDNVHICKHTYTHTLPFKSFKTVAKRWTIYNVLWRPSCNEINKKRTCTWDRWQYQTQMTCLIIMSLQWKQERVWVLREDRGTISRFNE